MLPSPVPPAARPLPPGPAASASEPHPDDPPSPPDVSLAPTLALPDAGSPAPPSRGFSRGLQLMAASALCFSVMSLLVKVAGARGVPTMQIVLVRCLVMTACTLALARQAGVSVGGNDRWTLAGRGLGGALALSLLYFALGRLPLGDATAVHYTAPLWTALLAAPVLGERVGRAVGLGLALSLGGVLLISRPSFLLGADAGGLDTLAVAAAAGGSVLSGAAYVLVRKLRRSDHPLTVVFWLSWIGVALALPFCVARWAPLDAGDVAVLVGVGLATQAAQVFMTRGLHLEAAGRATAVGYLQVVFAFVWGAVVFGTEPDVWSLAGAAVIVASTLLIARRS